MRLNLPCYTLLMMGFIFFNQSIVIAQIKLGGTVSDHQNSPIEFVSVGLESRDSLISEIVTDKNGTYRFTNIAAGTYNLKFKHITLEKDSIIQVVADKDSIVNVKLLTGHLMDEVIIEAKKAVFEREIDRLRFNVENTDLIIGNNVWEVLEKTPLVNIGIDENIQISGVSNAVVYINDKRKILSGNALKSYLSSLPSDNLQAIEVITTPPSKYEAEGGAGIINIITKKSKEEGFVGNAVLSTRQTKMNSQAASTYLNYRTGKWNLYSNLYLGQRKRKPEFQKNIYYDNLSDLQHRSIVSVNKQVVRYPGASLGLDYEMSKNHFLGFLFDYSGNKQKETRRASSFETYRDTDSLNFTNNTDNLQDNTYSFNLNYEGKLDSSGQRIIFNYDATIYNSSNKSISITDARNVADQSPLFVKDRFRSNVPQDVKSHSFKVDYELPINSDFSLDVGTRFLFAQMDNNIVFENTFDGKQWAIDKARSNHFKYDENILALYSTIQNKVSEQWTYQIGLRLENTIAKGWLEDALSVDRNYVNLFPTVFLKHTTKKDKEFGLALSGRITRPSYWDVNPFRTYTTNEAYFEGNPFLNPSKYYREELNHTINSKIGTFILQLAASQTLDEFYALPYNPTANLIVNRKVNYGNKYGFSQTATYFGQFSNWWRVSGTALIGYVLSKGDYENIIIDNKSFLASISLDQSFIISKALGLSGSVFANNTFPVTIVNTEIKNRLETEIRLRKAWNDLNFTLSAQDLFKSNKDRYSIAVDDLRVYDLNYHDTKSVALAVSYDFGKSSVKAQKTRDLEFEEIKQRIK